MSTLLVAVDGSQSALRAVEHAAIAAKRASADVYVLNVQLPIGAGDLVDRAQMERYQKEVGKPILDAAMATLKARGIAASRIG